MALIYETEPPTNLEEFGEAVVKSFHITFDTLSAVASKIFASEPDITVICFTKNALAFASLLNDSGHFGPVALYVEQELCVGERRHLQLTKASTIDGVVADVGSAMAVYSDVVDHPPLPTDFLIKTIRIAQAQCSHIERNEKFFASRLAKRLVWYTALKNDFRLHSSALNLSTRLCIENLAAFERTVAQCRLRTLV